MPVTPYHFGPGAAIKAAIPRYFSFTIFCFAQIVTDCETAYHMVRGEYPIHRVLHTYLGATGVALFCVIMGRPVCQFALRRWAEWRSAPFKRHFPLGDSISWVSTVTGAFIGTYSHVFLDSIMHPDVRPFSPFSQRNPCYQLVGLVTLHLSCIILGVFGAWYIAAHSTRKV